MKKNRFFGFFGQSDPEKIFSDAQNTIEVTGELEGTQFVHELGSEQIATDEGSKLSELAAERQKSRIADELAKQVYHQFREVGNKFYFKDDPQKIAFEVRGRKLISSSQDERVAKAMVAVCQSKGWTRLKISGDREFCRQVWLEASLCNLKSVGYQPTKQDLAELEALSAKKSKNSIEQDVVEKGQNPVHVTRTQPEKPPATQSTGGLILSGRSMKVASGAEITYFWGLRVGSRLQLSSQNMIRKAVSSAERLFLPIGMSGTFEKATNIR
ncbi:MAG: LPD7 domain-containing protein (plasmid) [Candidatus Symbiodolus clandestinus]